MLKNLSKKMILFTLVLVSCAKRGNIDGGMKDTIAPILKMSFPKNASTNYDGKLITLTFDEFVKLKDVGKQLIVSPPMAKLPEILPATASKFITIKIKDTLKPNTTYSFNFGQSIQDNNEGNAYKQFKYVVSTGSFIDSLQLKGVIKNALERKTDNFVNVMLYDVNDKFSDSIIYKKLPRYVTNTLDSLQSFSIENIKPGKYLLVAMTDQNNNFKFDPSEDKIGFQEQYISVPNDTLYELELFKEKIQDKILKPFQASGNKIVVPYKGKVEGLKLVLKNKKDVLESIVTKMTNKDSLQVWFTPIKTDSLQLEITRNANAEVFKLKYKEIKKDTLSFSPVQNGILELRDVFTVHSNLPLKKFDKSKMKLTDRASKSVDFTTNYDAVNQDLKIEFDKKPAEKYNLYIFPNGIEDYLGKANDSLKYQFVTKELADYGNLKVVLKNCKSFPIILEMTDEAGTVKYTATSTDEKPVEFNLINPSKYYLRLIYDANQNKVWDTGNYLQKQQSEEVKYFQKPLDIRANWDVEQVFDLDI